MTSPNISKKLSLEELRNLFKENEVKMLISPINKYNSLIVEDSKQVKLIRFNNIKKLNSMTKELTLELCHLIETKENKLYIFSGEDSNKLFCVGANLKDFYSFKNDLNNFITFTNMLDYVLYKFMEMFQSNSIFIWNGATMGGGLAIGIYSKFRIATESTILAMPESKFGFFANCRFNNFIHKIVDIKEALHMSLFSHQYAGYEVFSKGFATHFIYNKYIPNLLEDIKCLQITSDENIEIIINKYQNESLREFKDKESEHFNVKIKSFNEKMAQLYNFDFDSDNFMDFYENLKYNLEKNDKKLYNELLKRSLLSLKINFLISLSAYDKNLSFEDKYELDSSACHILVETGNMFEGIRAYFVDKDERPKWRAKF